MIRKVVEYMIGCDARPECPHDSFTAFGSRSQDECATTAVKDGWEQTSKRLWLCPDCSKQRKVRESLPKEQPE